MRRGGTHVAIPPPGSGPARLFSSIQKQQDKPDGKNNGEQHSREILALLPSVVAVMRAVWILPISKVMLWADVLVSSRGEMRRLRMHISLSRHSHKDPQQQAGNEEQ